MDAVNATNSTEQPSALQYFLAYLKAYYISTLVCSGMLFNMMILISAVFDRRWSRGERSKLLIASVGNMTLLLLRASINYWWGDGLFFSTGGAAYIYLDQTGPVACKVYRGVSAIGEMMAIWVATFETTEIANKLLNKRVSTLTMSLIYLVFFIITGVTAALSAYYAAVIENEETPIARSVCTFYYMPVVNQVLIGVSHTLLYVGPIFVMLCSVCIIIVKRCADSIGKTKRNGEARKRKLHFKSEEIVTFVKFFFYTVFLSPNFVIMYVRIASLITTGEDSILYHGLTIGFFILALILPTIDALLLFFGEKKFRLSLVHILQCRCCTKASDSDSESDDNQCHEPTLVSVGNRNVNDAFIY